MRRTLPYLTFVVVLGLTVASGAIHGWQTKRWGPSRDLLAAADRLQDVPQQVGDWRLESTEPLDDRTLATLECTGYFQRTYRNQATQQRVSVTVLLGPAGPISVHTPEICYSSRDYGIQEPPQRVNFEGPERAEHALWAMTFRSKDLEAAVLRVYYGWSSGGPWMAPDDSRFGLLGRPWLYKIQLAGQLARNDDPQTDDPCRAFLQAFLPVLQGYLTAPAAN